MPCESAHPKSTRCYIKVSHIWKQKSNKSRSMENSELHAVRDPQKCDFPSLAHNLTRKISTYTTSSTANCIMGTKQIVKVIILDPLGLRWWLGGGEQGIDSVSYPLLSSSLELPAMGNKHRIISITIINSWTSFKYLMTSKLRPPLVNSAWVQSLATKTL